mgnify:FL=1|jgi:16S rRNA (guanine966-N2)-methyltransferase
MTRIIAGIAKGRTLKVPANVTRPTSDRVREAVFSSLEHRLGSLQGLCVYDLYAGSGAFGLEAISRGATTAVLVERDRKAVDIIRQNVQTTGLPATVVAADVAQFVQRPPVPAPDVVFVDPPYDLPAATVRDQLTVLLRQLSDKQILLVVERSARDPESAVPDGCSDIDARTVGDTSITYAHWYGYRHDDA